MVVNGYKSACWAHPSRGANMNRRSLHRPPSRSYKAWNTSLTKDRDFDAQYQSLGPPHSKPRKATRPLLHGSWKPGGLTWEMIEGFTGIGAPRDEKKECETLKQRRKDFRTAVSQQFSRTYSHRDLLAASEHEIQFQEYIAENRHLPEFHDYLGKKKRALVQKKTMPKAPHHSQWNPGLPQDRDFTEQKHIGTVEYNESNLYDYFSTTILNALRRLTNQNFAPCGRKISGF